MMRKLLAASLFVLVLAVALGAFLQWMSTRNNIVSEPKSCYDIIIVGAGSAGCAVARRLSDATNLSVLVVEAGAAAPWFHRVPFLAPALQGSHADWGFVTAPQERAMRGLKGQQSKWPRGKALGGSSALNYMLHLWGTRGNFDRLWAPPGGDEWNYDSVRRYFQRAENFEAAAKNPDSRGHSGPMPVNEVPPSPLSRAFLEGASLLGIPQGDLSGEIEDGAMPAQSNIRNGWRYSTMDAYLDPILDKSNIHLLTNSVVVKILFDDVGRATGVLAANEVSRSTFRVEAAAEVVLCAGVIGTPHLLLLSGVGPARHLHAHQIPVVSDLPGVGAGLRDHLNVPLYFHLNASVSTTSAKVRSVGSAWKYLVHGEGPLSGSGVEAVVRIPVPGGGAASNQKLFFMLFSLGSVNEALFTAVSNFEKDAFRATFPDSRNDSKEGFVLLSSCTHPRSEGRVRLASPDPLAQPSIDPRYLTEEEDVRCLIKAMRMGARLGSTEPLRALGATLHLPHLPSCARYEQSLRDDRYLECWLRTTALTAYHPVGTCALGTALDHRLRVRGVQNLRVIDSSVFPHLTSGNPHAAVLMVAEKGADQLLEDLKKRRFHVSRKPPV